MFACAFFAQTNLKESCSEEVLLRQIKLLKDQLRYYKRQARNAEKKDRRLEIIRFRREAEPLVRLLEIWLDSDAQGVTDSVRLARINRLLPRIEGGKDNTGDLSRSINKRLGKAVLRLKSDLPALNKDELRLFCFCCAGFPASLIVEITGAGNCGTVYSRKNRLKRKICRLPPQKRDEYLDYLS